MDIASAPLQPRHPTSPFQRQPEPAAEQFQADDRVCHDSYGLGRVVVVDSGGATVDFSDRTLRITTPCRKMTKL